jgi:hypothetical protein
MEHGDFLRILFARKGAQKTMTFSHFPIMTPPFPSTPSTNVNLPRYPPEPQTTTNHTHTKHSTIPTHTTSLQTPFLTPPCHSNTQSRTKPSGKSPTSSAIVATTGTSSAPTLPAPQGRQLNHHHCNQCRQLTTSPKSEGNLALLHYYV